MFVKIGEGFYSLNSSFMTLFRYRLAYKESLLENKSGDIYNGCDKLSKLLYIATEEKPKPFEHEIKEELLSDDGVLLKAATELLRIICETDKSLIKKETSVILENTDMNFDEYEIMAAFANTGLPPFLLHEMTLAQVCGLISKYFDIKNGKAKSEVKELSGKEISDFYGLSPEKLERIKKVVGQGNG